MDYFQILLKFWPNIREEFYNLFRNKWLYQFPLKIAENCTFYVIIRRRYYDNCYHTVDIQISNLFEIFADVFANIPLTWENIIRMTNASWKLAKISGFHWCSEQIIFSVASGSPFSEPSSNVFHIFAIKYENHLIIYSRDFEKLANPLSK